LREPNVCRVDVSALLEFDAAKLAAGSRVIAACDHCIPGAHRPPGVAKPFCMRCGRDLAETSEARLTLERRKAL